MNTNIVEWRAPERRLPTTLQMLPVVAKEAKRRPLWLAAIFAAIALTALVMGLQTPKKFTSSTTLLVEETNIIEPLLRGRTTPTTVVDRAAIAREVAFSRKVMDDILRTGGWLENNPTALEKSQLIEQIKGRTEITNPRQNLKLVQITYSDSDPQRARQVTQRFADLVIEESLHTKSRESRAAFRFIDSQVTDYHKRLMDAESKLAAYRKQHPDVMIGDAENVAERITQLRTEMDQAQMNLADQQTQAGVWRSHVGRETSMAATHGGSSQLRTQLMELQAERNRLSGTVTAQHPDMVRISKQIAALEGQIRSGRTGSSAGASSAAMLSPENTAIRNRLAEAQSLSSASASRLAVGQRLMAEELARLQRVAALGGELADLTRNLEMNKTLYQDLLERRENARLAMNLDAQRGGLNFRVQEPASLPLQSDSVSLSSIAAGGLLLAALAPFALLMGWVRFDPRARSASQIEQISGLPVLGTIPSGRHYASASTASRVNPQTRLAIGLIVAVPVAYALAMILR